MILTLSLVIAVLFGTGAYLLLKRDVVRIVVGVVLTSHAANLFIMASGQRRGRAPVYPLPAGEAVSDPLVQAMALTAVVITFGISVLLLSLVYRVYTSDESLDMRDLAEAESRDEEDLEREAEVR